MSRKISIWAVHAFSIFMLLAASAGIAQDREHVQLKGLINDYSPSSVKGGPWEMHGQWTLDLHERWDNADFSADMTMSGYGTSDNAPDALLGGQNAHTHNIKLTEKKIIWNMDGCPTFSPATKQGFQISGTVSLLTGNGSNAPFETDPPSSTLQVCVTGGDEAPYSAPYSNITLVFRGPAATHFGEQPIHGVVKR
ncbi:hypothetical protein ACFPT7_17880 [Acidicapsa dinghuensis]|uniref:Type VI secretion system tube protein Hcp n=1 Tax=Acidicapsa dinghuensis TaxID=2218256 RepID=A0ABW1EK10_9BACT|nr:hypothetical protein [Acidicapsa dinghuensis]